MKATDLMIGDWLQDSFGNIGQVYRLDPGRVHLRLLQERPQDEEYIVHDIEPIALTPEILEKNGFKKETHFIDWKDRTLYKVGYDMYIIMNYYEDDNFTLCNIYNDSDESAVVIDISSINYVHKLQHALKMCGIDKEIMV